MTAHAALSSRPRSDLSDRARPSVRRLGHRARPRRSPSTHCGEACLSPRPKTTAAQRRAVYHAVLYPLVTELEQALPGCTPETRLRPVTVVIGFQTAASDRQVGVAVARVVARDPFQECASTVAVDGDPGLALQAALEGLGTCHL